MTEPACRLIRYSICPRIPESRRAMPKILVSIPLSIRFTIAKDRESGLFVGHVVEYPGFVTQGRTREAVERKLVRELRHTFRHYPDERSAFTNAKSV